MGQNYSAGAVPKFLRSILNDLSLVKVRALMLKFHRMRQGKVDVVRRDDMSLSREEIKWLLKLRTMQVYDFFRRYDPDHVGRIGFFDLWGSLALCATDNPDEKVEFIFGLADYNKSGYLTRSNLTNLMLCATRGLSRLKGIRAIELKILNKTIAVIAGMALVNENGAISLRDVRVCMLTDENCKAYFAGLGSQVTALVDSGKLVAQRRDILIELAGVEAQIDEVALRLNIAKESKESYEKERGGDISSLQIHELDAKPRTKTVPDTDLEEASSTQHDALFCQPSEEQRLRRLVRVRSLNTAKGNPLISDAVVFTDPKARNLKMNDNTGGDFDASAVCRKWNTLKCADDGMCELDVDTVEDLFEAAGIVLTDAEAENCLAYVLPNQLGLRRVEDVITWYRRKICTEIPFAIPLWRKVADDAHDTFQSLQNAIFQAVTDLGAQHKLVDLLAAKNMSVNTALAKAIASSTDTKEFENAENGALGVSVGEIQGSQRLVAWQRQQIQSPATLFNWGFSFGRPEEVPVPALPQTFPDEPNQTGKSKSSKLSSAAAKAQEKQREVEKAAAIAAWERNKWKLTASFQFSVTPPPTTVGDRPCFFDTETLCAKDDILAPDLLDYFKKRVPATQTTFEVNVPFGTSFWTIFNISPSTTAQEESMLIKLLVNFFESVPLDYRSNFYTKVEAKSLKMQSPGVDGDARIFNVVILLLLHEEDWFRNIEEKLPPGILLSRAFRKVDFSLRCLDSLDDLYKSSLSFESFDERLFGPQEDELGEEGMNPIRFAKLQRQRQQAIQESVARAFQMSDQELKMLLKDRGLSVSGDHANLATRARTAFKRQAEISGFGELSAWGSDICRRIYRMFTPPLEKEEEKTKDAVSKKKDKKDEPRPHESRGMTLWEINEMLLETGSETIYDKKDYKVVMEEQEFYVDKESRLLEEGIIAYYELYGHLAKDIRTLGIGSLSEKIKGEGHLFAAFEPIAFASLLRLLEDHPLLQKSLKIFVGLASSLSEISFESEFNSINDLFNIGEDKELEKIRVFLNSPGWLSSAIHKMTEWLANGEEGVLRSMRKSVSETFGKYHQWDEVFDDFFRNLSIPEQHIDDAITFSLQSFISEKLDEILPPCIKPQDKAVLSKAIELRELNIKLAEIIANHDGTFRLTRDQREALMALRARNELDAKDIIKRVEDEKQFCAMHALALYDGIRRCTTGIHSCGYGTKDMTMKITLTGCDWVQYLPKGVGEKSIPWQIYEDKLRRAAQRKEAAFAALERERIRKDKSNPDRIAAVKEKSVQRQQKKKEEELKMFEEAMNALQIVREERKTTQEIATMVRQWEKIQQMKCTRYPKSLAAAVSMNNLACVLIEFYGPDHFRGKDALKAQADALSIVLDSIVTLETHLIFLEVDDTTRIPLESDSRIYVHLEGTVPLNQDTIAEFVQNGTRVFEFAEENIIPFMTILQNSLTILRLSVADPRNALQLEKMGFVNHFVKQFYDSLPIRDRERVKKKQGKPLDGTMVLILGDIETQLGITAGEVQTLLAEGKDVESQGQDPGRSGIESDQKHASDKASKQQKRGKAKALSGGLVSKEDLEEEIALKKAERAEKEMKLIDQRRAANLKRAQTVRRRNRLYQLITSGDINRVFDLKAGHVLAEGSRVRWGTDEASGSGDPLDFLDSEVESFSLVTDDQTLTTFKTGSQDSTDAGPGRIKKSVQFDDESIVSRGGDSLASYNSRGDVSVATAETPPPPKPRGKMGLLSWLFRNRESLH